MGDSELTRLQQELEEYLPLSFRLESHAYEAALESEITSKDQLITQLRTHLDQSQQQVLDISQRYRRTEADLAKLQEKCGEMSKELERFQAEKRELEQLNDDWERSKR